MLCRMELKSKKKKRSGIFPVYLNVYDLTTFNGYAYWLGLGIYHSGVQVHDVEYAFGAHDFPTSGIFEVEPKQCPGFTFRKSILIGRTDLSPKEVRRFMENLAEEYPGNGYQLITKNCNHFCNDACTRLTGKAIPSWINRLARLGLLCNCILPAELSDGKVHVRPGRKCFKGDEKKFRSQSSRYASTSGPPAMATSSWPERFASKRRRQRRSFPTSVDFACSAPGSTISLQL